ncbi:MAG TPA: endonuclease III [Luteitalea sp.]|nr:endonuclease III [Luteitalea sp.]
MPRASKSEPALVPAPAVLERLLRHYPAPDTELAYTNAFELLIATVLSAQSTDRRVNETTPALFAKYPDATTLAVADPVDVEPIIVSTGFFRVKSKAIVTLSQRLVQDFGGEVPADMDALTTLPGVGRKTANVVLGHALGVPGLPVDRHVLRVAERIGLTRATTPEQVEQDLCAATPREDWTRMSDALILHGRRICRPKPQCAECEVNDICRYPFKTGGVQPLDLAAPVQRSARKAVASSRNRPTSRPATKKDAAKAPGPRPKAQDRPTSRPATKGKVAEVPATTAGRATKAEGPMTKAGGRAKRGTN